MAEKKTIEYPDINLLLTSFIERHKAGSPTEDNVYWISLKPCEVSKLFYEKHQIQVSHGLVKRFAQGAGIWLPQAIQTIGHGQL